MTQIPLQLWLGSCSFLGLTLEAPWGYFIGHKWLLFVNVRDFTSFNILSMMQRGRNMTHKLRSQCQKHLFNSICILKPVSRNLKSHLKLSLKRKKDSFHLLLVVAPDEVWTQLQSAEPWHQKQHNTFILNVSCVQIAPNSTLHFCWLSTTNLPNVKQNGWPFLEIFKPQTDRKRFLAIKLKQIKQKRGEVPRLHLSQLYNAITVSCFIINNEFLEL